MTFRAFPLCLLALLAATVAHGQERRNDLAAYDAKIKQSDREHWAYLPVKRPPVPAVKDRAWLRNPIDAFVLANLEAEGMRPAAPAPPRALLRRVYLDLTGLPPTPAEQEAFLRDTSPDAWERLIDNLLTRPAHGERWARHWLDVVRYAETNGYERDAARPFVWRYRDWVIRAVNRDLPYDRFVLEQLAGDELPDADGDSMIATGYYRLGPWDDEPADPQEDRFDQLDDLVGTTSMAFLGLTLHCARCHDHKFEALTMHDYYRMVAVFNGLDRPRDGRTELALPAAPRKAVEAEKARRARIDEVTRTVVTLQPLGLGPAGAAPVLAARRAHLAGELPRGYFLHEPAPRPPDAHILLRGKASRPGPKVAPGLPAVLVRTQPPFPEPGPHSSRRRLTFARWVASPDNPLTARVWVNRVWQGHFGEGLVRTPSDFGIMGDRPSHPELLDWLADWFVANGWSTRKLHRLILTSNTYRMSKAWSKEYADRDPENRNLWRFPYRRLEAEAIRDSVLAASGRLNRRMYGMWTYPEVPKEALAGSSDPGTIWKPFDEEDASRRTVYAHVKRSFVVPLLEVLDLCDTTRSSEKRLVTTVAPQALSLFNGEFVNRQARHLAARLAREAGDDPSRQIERAYLLALCRPPTDRERAALLAFLDREARSVAREQPGLDPAAARRLALEQACRVVFNLNEFVYPD